MRGDKLHERYPKEYSSWKNMKSRSSGKGYTVAPEFQEFKDFLEHMGPIPADGYTLNRIENDLREYSPDNCEWSSKLEQANNRRNTIMIMFEGHEMPLAEVARLTNQSPDTLRRRKQRGFSDQEVVSGRTASSSRTRARQPSRPPLIRHPVEPIDDLAEARWLGDEKKIETWLRMYFGTEDTGHFSYSWNEADLPLPDFVQIEAEKAIRAIETGDFSKVLPPFKQVAAQSSAQQLLFKSKLLKTAEAAFAEVLTRKFPASAVTAKDGVRSIELIWLQGDQNNSVWRQSLRRVVLAFDFAKIPLPAPLAKLWETNRHRWMK